MSAERGGGRAIGDRATSRFRRDIHGLRAVAVGLVVLYHAGVPGLRGGYVGVDVFFVISGFLITSHLLSQLEATGRLGLASFYAKRVRRILPVAFFVLIVTAIASLVFLPPLRIWDVMKDAAATALYVPNLLFAATGTNYLAETAPSPFQHYWSLGVEEQFYLFWPLILWGVFRLWRRVNRGLLLTVAALVSASFVAGLVLTSVSQPWAFFGLPTRAWELGTGGLVAIAVLRGANRLPQVANAVAGWAGLAMIIASGVLYDSGTLFPGYAALVPTVGAALLLWSGSNGDLGPLGPVLVLGTRPFQFIGTVSYSMYLWHWPLLVVPVAAMATPLPLWAGLLIAALTVPLSWASYRYVEEPAQKRWSFVRARPRRSIFAALAMSAVVAVASIGTGVVADTQPLDAGRAAAHVAFSSPPQFTSFVPDNLTPSLHEAESSNPALYSDGCHLDYSATSVQDCAFGDPDASRTVALFGDSHAAQWFPALQRWAIESDVRLETYTKSACPSADVETELLGNRYKACSTWRNAVVERLAAESVDLLILANYSRQEVLAPAGSSAEDAWRNGLSNTVDRIDAARSVVLQDTPFMGVSPSICLSANLTDTSPCAVDRSFTVNDRIVQAEAAAAESSGASVISLNDLLCNATSCEPVIGDVLVYRDAHHLTVEASEALAEPLGRDLAPYLPG